ncbi:EthD domain-containing protein [Roseomonas sp. AR75]|uniref:EthD domain-containing protein n=1 Tax=Roseomonas sp. AR75 TaxID=2562311 RepID=UPI0010BF9876|nr:EthD domain-containing protein [Roseomonas sp. AR75]
MPKSRLFLAAPAGTDRPAFRARLLAETGPALRDAVPALAAISLDLVDATPAVPPWQRPGEPAPPTGEPDYDAVVDLWGDAAALDAARRVLSDLPRIAVGAAETVEKDDLPRPVGRAPGVKFLSLMTFQPDLPEAAARRLWAHHAPLALEVHIGMARYVRDWVIAGAAPFHGIAELHFPSVEAMTARWFRDAAGRAAIAHDVGHFLLRATRLYTTEHVLKAHP